MTMEGSRNLALSFVAWWYGEAAAKLFLYLKFSFLYLADFFSARACLATLFAPWKRDEIDSRGLSLQDQFHVLVLNLTSRLVGMMVKLIVLSIFTLTVGVLSLLCLLIAFLWFLWPLIAIILLYSGFLIIFSNYGK